MTTFNDSVPSFLGGVSQQAAALRSNNVVDDAVNVEALPTEGLTKRYPTLFQGELKDPSGASLDLSGARFVAMERDDEDYILAFGSDVGGDGYVYAWKSDGTAVPCEDLGGTPTNFAAYLNGAADTDIRHQQVADALFVANRSVAVEGAPGDGFPQWYQDNPGAGMAVLVGMPSMDYTVTIKTESMGAPATVSYRTLSSGLATSARWGATINPVAATGTFNDPNLSTRRPVFLHSEVVSQDLQSDNSLNASNWEQTIRPEVKNDIVFYYAPSTINAIPTLQTKVLVPTDDWEIDVWSGAIRYIGSDAAVLAAPNWIFHQVRSTNWNHGTEASHIIRELMLELQEKFDGGSFPQIVMEGNTVGDRSNLSDVGWHPRPDVESNALRVYFPFGGTGDDAIEEFELMDNSNGDFTSSWQEEIDDLSSLPVYWKDGAVVKITGATTSTVDDEIIEFVTNGEDVDFGRGIWRETNQRGLPTGGFNSATMPISVQRAEDGAGGYKFIHGAAPWSTRQVGDEDSSKEPSFVGSRITDVFFHENRIGFLAGPGMVLSESGEFYNFWRTTLTALPESDPVDVTLANLDGDTVYHALPYDSRLFVFSEDGQAAVTSQGPLGPTTIEAPVVSKFHVSPTTAPVVQGRSMFLPYVTGDYTQLRQVVPGQYQSDYQDAQVTIGVPQYLPKAIKTIAMGMSSDAMVFLTGDSSRVFVYQYLQSGGQQVMNAWTSWEFLGSTVVDCVAIQDQMFFGMVRDGKTYLESLRFGLGRGDTTTDFEPRLDRRVGPLTGTYDVATDTTVFNVDFDFTSFDNVQATASEEGLLALGTTLPVVDQDPVAGTLSVRGDVSAQPMVLGIPYDSRVVLSKPYFKAQSPRGGLYHQVGGRQLCRALNIHLSDTGYLKATVDCVGAPSASEEFLGDVMGQTKLDASTLRSGDFRIPINADVQDFRVTLSNDSAFPSTLVTGAWTLRLNRKKSTR